jgi:hypothetical protein
MHEADVPRCLLLVRFQDLSGRAADFGRLPLVTRSCRRPGLAVKRYDVRLYLRDWPVGLLGR